MLKDAIADMELGPSCPTAAMMWKRFTSCFTSQTLIVRHFPGKTQVSYKALLNALIGQLNTKLVDKRLHLKCFEALVAHQKKQGSDATSMVNIHQFGLIMSWFGPMEGYTHEPVRFFFLFLRDLQL